MIVGHHNMRRNLVKLVTTKLFPQTTLFYGLNGSGKKQVALLLAQCLLCEKLPQLADDLTSCGTCHSCRTFQSGNHPDFFLIAPTAPKSQKSADKGTLTTAGSIKTEQIVELKKRILYPPLIGERQVVIIDDAELMTTVTANSLLKILEEPRDGKIFILITRQLSKILVTIRSRASRFFFAPLTTEEVRSIVAKHVVAEGINCPQELLDFYLECFPGSPAHVVAALRMPLDLEKLASVLAKDHRFLEISSMVRDVLAEEFDIKLFLQCLRGFILRHARTGALLDLSEVGFLDRITSAERQLQHYIPAEFVLENLFL